LSINPIVGVSAFKLKDRSVMKKHATHIEGNDHALLCSVAMSNHLKLAVRKHIAAPGIDDAPAYAAGIPDAQASFSGTT
jgi:hypothetical protein